MKQSMVRILDPRFVHRDPTTNRLNTPELRDYIVVPRLSLIGEFSFADMLSDEAHFAIVSLYAKLKNEKGFKYEIPDHMRVDKRASRTVYRRMRPDRV